MKNMMEITFHGGRLWMLLAKSNPRKIERISQKLIYSMACEARTQCWVD